MAQPKINWFKLLRLTFARDIRGLIYLKRTDRAMAKLKRENASVPGAFRMAVEKNPTKVVLENHVKKWTFRELDEFSNQMAHVARSYGLKKDDEVALFLNNCPEFLGIWLGLAKAGCITSLINTNHRMKPLAHSITTVNTKAVIFDAALASAIDEVKPLLGDSQDQLMYFQFTDEQLKQSSGGKICDPLTPDVRLLNVEMEKHDASNFNLIQTGFTDRLLYVHTSGTTGLPKAAIIRHSRFFFVGYISRTTTGIKDDDVIYTCLPLYHVSGGVLGSSQAVLFGTKVAIGTKFSATNFWTDCMKFNATVAQYIGELCRYLYNQPERPEDKLHKVRKMYGNGMRTSIWQPFIKRFGLENINEIYGSTEGNVSVSNFDGKPGACGFTVPTLPRWLLKLIYPISLIKVDSTTGDVIRDPKTGLCIPVEAGEVGMFVGRIVPDPVRSYDGYTNSEASKKKIIHDVFSKGDAAYASGDLLVMDELGYLYFQDRTGDTFRWKGENVSTIEVENVVSGITDQAGCVSYGVLIPGNEGRAGMITIEDPGNSLNLSNFLSKIMGQLPFYAVPVMLRIVREVETTSTLKTQKGNLVKEAFDINQIKDPLYVLNKDQTEYIRIDERIYQQIMSGQYKF